MRTLPASAMADLAPLMGTPYYWPARKQVEAALINGGVRRARAKARIIRDTWDTGVGVAP